jgi:two-component system OmpR family response regulator
MTRVLIVDSPDSAAPLKYHLQEEGFLADIESQASLLTYQLFSRYAIIIMETTLADIDGFTILRRLREKSGLPVMVLTDRDNEDSRLEGLDLGADQYIGKPCSPREVLARARAVLRRANPQARLGLVEVLHCGRLSMWPAQGKAEWRGEPLLLSSGEYQLLETLLRSAGRPVSKNELAARGLTGLAAQSNRSVDVHVSSIRRKLGGGSNGQALVQAVHFNGYQLMIS